jgi:hypothetical protein
MLSLIKRWALEPVMIIVMMKADPDSVALV